MFDVIERANQAIQQGENLTLDVLQSYADMTKDIEATKDVLPISRKIRKDTLTQAHRVVFTF